MVKNKIFYLYVYDYNINIGGAMNEHISCLPEDCWVCVVDADSIHLNPKFGHQLNDIINKHGEDFALFGCVTNRLGDNHQLYNKKFCDDLNVKTHFERCIELANNHYDEVEETKGVAGILMLFKRSTWVDAGGFKENEKFADSLFNTSIKVRKLGKIGLMKGFYMFHAYRIWQEGQQSAKHDITHLIGN